MFELMPFSHKYQPVSIFDPFREMEAFERRFFGEPFFNEMRPMRHFRTDIRDQGESYLLEADLPGFRKEDIRLEVENGALTVRAERHEEKEEKGDSGYIQRERRCGSYVRSFDLTGIDADQIRAAYENGVLKLTLPKLVEPETSARQISID